MQYNFLYILKHLVNIYMKYFLSFGNERFTNSRKRIKLEAEQTKLFDEIIIETETVCQEETFEKICNKIDPKWGNGRGFYWYMWKPYIINKTLAKLNDGDILFYNDSGMQIFPERQDVINKFKNLFQLVEDTEKCKTGICTFITTGPPKERYEYMYNIGALFKHFKVENNELITHTQQIQAGVIIIKKCNESQKIIKEWLDTASNHTELFVGDMRVLPRNKEDKEMPGFRDHRHDQAVWSVLCKLNNVNVLQHDMNPIYQTHYRC